MRALLMVLIFLGAEFTPLPSFSFSSAFLGRAPLTPSDGDFTHPYPNSLQFAEIMCIVSSPFLLSFFLRCTVDGGSSFPIFQAGSLQNNCV